MFYLNRLKNFAKRYADKELLERNKYLTQIYIEVSQQAEAYRSALVLKHNQATGACTSFMEIIGAFLLTVSETGSHKLSADLLASASAMPICEFNDGEDGSIVVAFSSGDEVADNEVVN